jgi:hypothetical protein
MSNVKDDTMPFSDRPAIHRIGHKRVKQLVALRSGAAEFGEQAMGSYFQHWHKSLDARDA